METANCLIDCLTDCLNKRQYLPDAPGICAIMGCTLGAGPRTAREGSSRKLTWTTQQLMCSIRACVSYAIRIQCAAVQRSVV